MTLIYNYEKLVISALKLNFSFSICVRARSFHQFTNPVKLTAASAKILG